MTTERNGLVTGELTEIPYGWQWGAMRIELMTADPKIGTVLRVYGADSSHRVEIRVSPHGRSMQVTEVLA